MYESFNQETPLQVDRILNQVEQQEGQPPTMDQLYWAILCWSKTKRKTTAQRIDALYQPFRLQYLESITSMPDETRDRLSTVLMHLLHACHHVGNAHLAEDAFLKYAEDCSEYEQLEEQYPPTLEMAKLVLTTWSRSESSRRAARAEKLLSLLPKDPVLPDPDIACYTAVLSCWASSNKPNAPQRAELLLRQMEFSDPPIVPNLRSYTCLLNAWSRSHDADAPDQAERILQEMTVERGLPMDRIVYTAMITAWGRSPRRKDSIQQVEYYFDHLKQNETPHGLQATVVEYTATIQAWANHVTANIGESRRAVDRVHELLEEMILRSKDNEALKPNRMTFVSMLDTIRAARRIPDRRDRAKGVLKRMKSLNLAPNPYILRIVDQCSAQSSKKEKQKPKSKPTRSSNKRQEHVE
eukprot:Nitzschia sp. Nitz4//scaffold322_size40381//5032//6264//NITZ4_007553-RA/size40381-processed-gene-0.17-mRNA-1//-1//CDS//3329547806//8223//frame0